MALGGVSYSSVTVDATGNHSHPVSLPLFLFQMADCEGPGAPAQQAVRDPQRSVPRPAGGGAWLLTHTLLPSPAGPAPPRPRGSRPLTCLLGQALSLLPGPGHCPLLQAIFLSPQTQSQFHWLVLRARMGWTVVLGRLSHLVLMCYVLQDTQGVCVPLRESDRCLHCVSPAHQGEGVSSLPRPPGMFSALPAPSCPQPPTPWGHTPLIFPQWVGFACSQPPAWPADSETHPGSVRPASSSVFWVLCFSRPSSLG